MPEIYDCVVVGAGPAGGYAARLLAENGMSVLILEEHEQVGTPVHCTGIVGEKLIEKFQVPPHCIINRVNQVKCHFPSGDNFVIPTVIRPFVIDRALFDKLLFQRALEAGAHYKTSAHVKSVEKKKDSVRIHFENGSRDNVVEGKLCVIAVGAMSSLPRTLGFESPGSDYHTVQMDTRLKDINGIELYLGNRVAPGSFAYGVSTGGDTAKIGLITGKDPRKHFHYLLESSFMKGRILESLGSPRYRRMPFGVVRKSVSGRILTVGDSASQLKVTTGGGVFYGMRCAEILAETARKAFDGSNFNLSRIARYDGLWKQELKMELTAGMMLRRFLEKADDAWWDRIPNILKNEEIHRMMSSYKDFDYHYRFIFGFFRHSAPRNLILDLLRCCLTGSPNIFEEGEVREKVLPSTSLPPLPEFSGQT